MRTGREESVMIGARGKETAKKQKTVKEGRKEHKPTANEEAKGEDGFVIKSVGRKINYV